MLSLRYPHFSLGGHPILWKQQEQNWIDHNIFENETKHKVDGFVH